jgi:hypothetical protein
MDEFSLAKEGLRLLLDSSLSEDKTEESSELALLEAGLVVVVVGALVPSMHSCDIAAMNEFSLAEEGLGLLLDSSLLSEDKTEESSELALLEAGE